MKKKIKTERKGKMLSAASGVSGTLSFLGGWQICHNLCLAIIVILSAIGITVAGMPLLFLTQYAIYFWSAAAVLLIPTLIMYWKNRTCMSNNLAFFNIGIVIASVPFFQSYQAAFWLIGGIIILYSIWGFLRRKFGK